MKIGIVTPTYYPYPGGVTEHVYHTRCVLERQGHDVRVITTSFGRGDGSGDRGVIRIGRSVPIPANGSLCPVALDLKMARRVRDVLERERFDVLHIHEPFMPALCLAALREAGVPVVGTFHASNESPIGYRMFRSVLSRYAVKSRVVYPLVDPPFPSMISSNLPSVWTPPLNIMCSKRCEIPVMPGRSLRDPAR